jgi:hypothetical protein
MLVLDFERFASALSNTNEEEIRWYLDTQTGAIYCWDTTEDQADDTAAYEEDYSDLILNPDPVDETKYEENTESDFDIVTRLLIEEPKRLIKIEKLPAKEGFNIMKAFIQTLPKSQLRTQLDFALTQKSPFKRFREAIKKASAREKQRWYAFEDKQLLAYMDQWLKKNNILAEIANLPGYLTNTVTTEDED